MEGELGLHVEKDLVDFDMDSKEVASLLNQVLGELLTGSVESAVANITLPELESFDS